MKLFRPRITALFILLITVLAACVPPAVNTTAAPAATATVIPVAGEIHLTDDLGRSVTLTQPARRIISLAPSNTEILFAIGAGAQMIGRDSFSDFPAEAKALQDIGGAVLWQQHGNDH